MYLSAITIAAYIAAGLFIILLIRTFWNVTFPQLWQLAKQKVKTTLRIKSQIEKALAKGEREFLFRNGTVRIYAKTLPMAIYKYKQLQRKEKEVQQILNHRRLAKKVSKAESAPKKAI